MLEACAYIIASILVTRIVTYQDISLSVNKI